jgi:hypothetical protein
MVSSFFIVLAFVGSNNRLHDMGHVSESVDMIELNHFFDRQGRHVYDQVIFYERLASTGQFRVRAWCLVEDRESLNRRPVWNAITDQYHVDWLDSDQAILRSIRSPLFRETWTQYDPERLDKKHLEERYRLALIKPSKERQAAKSEQQAVRLAQLEIDRNADKERSGASEQALAKR